MKTYRITVNGVLYEVCVEAVDGAAVAAAPVAAPAPAAEPAPAAPAAAPVAAGENTVTSPMPGSILDVKVQPGDAVKAGQVLMILEAMKMENEIMSPADGTVAKVYVTKGSMVESGAALCELA